MSEPNVQADDALKASRFLIEIDTLFDTRLAVLASMGEDALTAAASQGYYERQSDYFVGVDYERFKSLYAARDKSILKDAIITPIANMAKEFATATLHNVNNSPFHYKPEILLNIYPYDLTENEIALMIKGLSSVTMGLCDIIAVNLSPVQLSPLYLKLNLAMMAIYEYDKWLEANSVNGAWKKHTAPDVTVIAPRISMIKMLKPFPKGEDPFEAMQQQAKPFIDLKLVPIEHFSIALKPEQFAKANETKDNT